MPGPVASPPERAARAPWMALLVIGALAGGRLWLAATVPLTDTTEARFGEIARKMVETGNWLTPQHAYGVPYLAKPPLAFWLSAAGIELFGPNELGPRAPILGASLGFCALFYGWLRRELGPAAAMAGSIMLISSLQFFTAMAAVMTDMVLTVCVTLALLAFWVRYHGGSRVLESAMYVALGLGLLAKGPLAAVLFFGPVFAWAAGGRAREVWSRFAWLKGALLTAAVAVPWYAAAEWKNPGFLDYFIVGEHLRRFLEPGWTGDLYGRAHAAPRGTIWLYFALGALPWSVLCVPALIAARETVQRNWRERRDLVLFALAATLTPLLLFTFSGNIILPYALPAVPAAVIAVVALLTRPDDERLAISGLRSVALVTVIVLVALVTGGDSFIEQHSQRPVISAIAARHPARDLSIYYWQSRYFSADYYSGGAATVVADQVELERAIAARRKFCLVVAEKERETVPGGLRSRLLEVGDVNGFVLLEPAYTVTSGLAPLSRVWAFADPR